MLRTSCLAGLALSSLFLSQASLHASVIVAGTNPASSGFSYVSDSASGSAISVGQFFTLTSPASITSLSINAASYSKQTLEAQLFSGSGLSGTGTLLQTFVLSVSGGFDGVLADIPTLTIPVSFELGTGNFSLVLSDPGSDSDYIYFNAADSSNTPDGSLGGVDNSISPGTTASYNLVFSLDGTVGQPTPEPEPIWLFSIGLMLTVGGSIARKMMRCRRSNPIASLMAPNQRRPL